MSHLPSPSSSVWVCAGISSSQMSHLPFPSSSMCVCSLSPQAASENTPNVMTVAAAIAVREYTNFLFIQVSPIKLLYLLRLRG